MTDIQNPPKVVLTAEEKKEKNREYMRNYMMNRRHTDPEFAEKQKKKTREIQFRKYNAEDPSFRQKKTEYNVVYYQKLKEAYKEARISVKKSQ